MHIPSRYSKQVIQPQISNTKSEAIMIKPNYATQDLVTKLKLSKGKTTLGIQLLKKLERTFMVSNKGLRLKVLSRVLITCFSCFFGSQHKDDEFFSILG